MKKFAAVMALLIFVAACPMLRSLAVLVSYSQNNDDVSQGVSVLDELAAADADKVESRVVEQRLERIEKQLEQNKLESLQQAIEQVEAGELSLRKVFRSCAFAGDSLMDGLKVYGILNPSTLFTQVSASLDHLKANAKAIVKKNPQTLFLHYGLNMISPNQSQLDSFIKRYKQEISSLKKQLPNTRIIISLLFPVDTSKATAERFKYVGRYNNALIKMCEEAGVEYLDSSSVVKSSEKDRAKDGIHLAKPFYVKWLLYIMQAKEIYQ